MQTDTEKMGRLREMTLPVYNHELKKFIPMVMIMICVLFNYTILRDTKDSLIATGAGAGPEAIPYLKSIFVMSAAIFFVVMYTKLTNIFSSERLFYIIVGTFLLFFLCFSFIIYPNIASLHPNLETVQALQAQFPRLKFLVSVWGVWTYSLFYVLSELWGSVMISLLFWQFANEIVKTNEAKRFYPLFILFGNIAPILSGATVRKFSNIRGSLPPEVDAWGVSLKYLSMSVFVVGVLAMIIYHWMHKNVLTDPKYYSAAEDKGPKKKKAKLGIMESFKYIFTNPYIGLIALMVLSYGASINLVEVIWKKQLAIQFYGDPNGFNAFMGGFSVATGTSTVVILLLTKSVIRRFGWFVGAIITPTVLAITGMIFFALVLFSDALNPTIMAMGFTATYMAVIVGAVQNVLTKGTKYAFFDPTKEMAYIPLDQELKVKGKAAVDVIGGRLGKAMGGWTIMVLFFILAAKDAMVIAPYLSYIILGIVIAWIFGVFALSKKYNALVKSDGSPEASAESKRPEVLAGKVTPALQSS